jgi:hypothetical protein
MVRKRVHITGETSRRGMARKHGKKQLHVGFDRMRDGFGRR